MDDLIVTGSSSLEIDEFVQHLHRQFSLRDLGDLNFFLGIEVTRSNDCLYLCQHKYIRDLLTRAKMHDAKPIGSPTEPYSRLCATGDPMAEPSLYRSVVGALQYVTITRPELAYAINRVCQYM